MKNKLDKYISEDIFAKQFMDIEKYFPNLVISNNQDEPMEIFEETEVEEVSNEETWSKNSQQNVTVKIPRVFEKEEDKNEKLLIDLDY